MSLYPVLRLLCFAVCFGVSFYALSSLKFEKFCHVQNPAKVRMLLFLLTLVLAHLSTEAFMSLTYMNGL